MPTFKQFVPGQYARNETLVKTKTAYSSEKSAEKIGEYQLQRFNSVWKYAVEQIPFYAKWAEDHHLPTEITALDELAYFPRITKSVITENFDLICQGVEYDGFYSTGGSTGTPTRFPKLAGESADRFADIYTARSWIGIAPKDKYVHLWGHSHLFGSGALAPAKKAVRNLKDWSVGAKRLNAYDLSPEANIDYAQRLANSRATYMIGYTSAVLRVAAAAKSISNWAPPPSLRAVIVTAETCTKSDISLIESTFKVPCYIEYGAAETGVIAHSLPSNAGLRTLYRSHILMTDRNDELTVSTLQNRAFPLINYEIGDRVTASKLAGKSIIEIDRIDGRAQESVKIPTRENGFHDASAIMLVHICKSLAEVTSVQAFSDLKGNLVVTYTPAIKNASPIQLSRIISELETSGIEADGERIHVQPVDNPITTKAGKLKVVISYEEGRALLSD